MLLKLGSAPVWWASWFVFILGLILILLCISIVFKMAKFWSGFKTWGPSIISCECSTNFTLEQNSSQNERHCSIMWIALRRWLYYLMLRPCFSSHHRLYLHSIHYNKQHKKKKEKKRLYILVHFRKCVLKLIKISIHFDDLTLPFLFWLRRYIKHSR